MKTNAVRLLDSLGVTYELREYEVDPEDLAAESVAAKIGMPPEQVFKTLLARGDRNGPCFAVIPGNYELDLKALAKLSGDRKVELVSLKEVQPLTGYIRGGVTVLGAKKDYPVFADETIELWDVVSVSAGVRGTQVLLAPADYLRVTKLYGRRDRKREVERLASGPSQLAAHSLVRNHQLPRHSGIKAGNSIRPIEECVGRVHLPDDLGSGAGRNFDNARVTLGPSSWNRVQRCHWEGRQCFLPTANTIRENIAMKSARSGPIHQRP